MDLGPENPNNEFVKSGLEKQALGNQIDLRMEFYVERMKKKKGLCLNQSSSARSEEVYSYILFFSLVTNFHPPSLQCFFFPFISSSTFIPTSHVYPGGLVLILVSSAPYISLHVVAITLKHMYHIHINVARKLAAMHLMWRQQFSLEILHDHVLSYSSVILIFSYGMVQKVAFVDKILLRTSALVIQGKICPQCSLLECYD